MLCFRPGPQIKQAGRYCFRILPVQPWGFSSPAGRRIHKKVMCGGTQSTDRGDELRLWRLRQLDFPCFHDGVPAADAMDSAVSKYPSVWAGTAVRQGEAFCSLRLCANHFRYKGFQKSRSCSGYCKA